MMKLFTILAIALFVITACSSSITGNVVLEQEKKLCAILPMTGLWAFHGDQVSKGLEIVAKEHGYVLIIEDDAYEPRKTVIAAHSLLNRGCKTFIIAYSEVADPIKPLLEENTIQVMVVFDVATPEHAEPYMFSTGVDVREGSHNIARFAKGENAVVIHDYNVWANMVSDEFIQAFPGRILERIMVSEGDDLRSVVTKIKSLDPDALMFTFGENDPVRFIKLLREQNVRANIYSNVGLPQDMIDALGSAANGICKTDLETVSVFEEYAGPTFVAFAYDAGLATILAEQNAGFENLTFTSITGQEMNFKEIVRKEVIYCIQDGELILQE